jgi:hypothetical protein
MTVLKKGQRHWLRSTMGAGGLADREILLQTAPGVLIDIFKKFILNLSN